MLYTNGLKPKELIKYRLIIHIDTFIAESVETNGETVVDFVNDQIKQEQGTMNIPNGDE